VVSDDHLAIAKGLEGLLAGIDGKSDALDGTGALYLEPVGAVGVLDLIDFQDLI